jgi:hypothetical protein
MQQSELFMLHHSDAQSGIEAFNYIWRRKRSGEQETRSNNYGPEILPQEH